MHDDPFYWTVEQVLDFFRNEAAAFICDLPDRPLPDLPAFLQALSDNGIAGLDLLTAVDGATLKDDFAIRSIRLRTSVLHCISKLRTRSRFVRERDEVAMTQILASVAAPEPSATLVELPRRPREGEVEVQDEQGRKRRKLDLSTTQQPQAPPQLQPDTFAPLPHPRQQEAFLSDSGLPIDELFYGKTPIGQVIPELPPDAEIIEGNDDETNEAFWTIHPMSHVKPAGDVGYVYSQLLHHFQHKNERTVRRKGRDAIAILPYREKLQPSSRPVSATVFRIAPAQGPIRSSDATTTIDEMEIDREEDVVAVRENAAFLDGEVDYDDVSAEATLGEWDFLVNRHRDSDGLLPEYGESDTQSTSPSLRKELEEEQAELEEERNQCLTEEEVTSVIEQCISDYVNKWTETKLPRREGKLAWTTWRQTKQSRTIRDGLIEQATSRIRKLDERLAKQKAECFKEQWRTANKLRKVCEVMQISVEDREVEEWKIRTWQSKQEPAHGVIHTGQQTSKKGKPFLSANGPGFAVHPDDRFSISPAPRLEDGNEGEETEYHSPKDVEGPDRGDSRIQGDAGDAGDDEMSLAEDKPESDFIVDDNDHEQVSLVRSRTADATHEQQNPHMQSTPSRKPPEPDSDLDSDPDSPFLPEQSTFINTSQYVKAEQALKTPTKRPVEVIEISSDSGTPASSGHRKKSAATRYVDYTRDPLLSVASEVDDWEFRELVKRKDRMRLLIKLFKALEPEQRKLIQAHFIRLRRVLFADKLLDALRALKENVNNTGEDEAGQVMIQCAKLFLAHNALKPELSQSVAALEVVQWDRFIHNKGQAEMFTDVLGGLLRKVETRLFTASKAPTDSSLAAKQSAFGAFTGTISDSEQEPSTKRKRKRKSMLNDQAIKAMNSQTRAFDRQYRFNALQASSSQELTAIVQTDASRSAVQVNLLKSEDQKAIFVDSEIAEAMKDHQIAGVQFMWREITALGDDGGQGCILAHTMGLGKTMQTITFLVALNEAAQSNDSSVYQQLPPHLQLEAKDRQLRVLIICPPNLIQNWRNEISKWAPEKLGNVFSVESADRNDHVSELKTWHKYGGILLIGYSLFLRKVGSKAEKQTEEVQWNARYLLQSPDVVVADEAHHLKNEKSGTSLAANRIKTESRIALTGTPMSNDVQEIYALVSWVAPNYLGETKHFSASYAVPIRQGNSVDSTTQEVRRGKKKLAVLQRNIEPKVNRAGITVLKGSLRNKVEFVITVPLTSTQRSIYSKFVELILGSDSHVKAGNMTVFGWLTVLILLTTHPVAFKRKLIAPPKETRRKSRDLTPTSSDSGFATPIADGEQPNEPDETDEAVTTLGFSDQTIRELTADIPDVIDSDFSAKMTVLIEIIDLSKQCGDKVLLFSHYLAPLNYLEELFSSRGIRFERIDGEVPTVKREGILAKFESSKFDVLLISTRAGGVGLNMQCANRVIILDSHFNPSHEEQAIGRAYRLGQEKPVYVYRFFTGGTFEEEIYKRQLFKLGLTSRVIDKKNTKRSGVYNTREYLYQPREVLQRDLRGCLGKDDAVLDPIVQNYTGKEGGASALIRGVETMETLQEEVHDEPLTAEEKLEVEQEFQHSRTTRAMERKGVVPWHGSVMPPPSTAPVRGRPSKNRTSNNFSTQASNGLPSFVTPTRNSVLPTNQTEPAPQINASDRPSLVARLPLAPRTVQPVGTVPTVPHGLPYVSSSTAVPETEQRH